MSEEYKSLVDVCREAGVPMTTGELECAQRRLREHVVQVQADEDSDHGFTDVVTLAMMNRGPPKLQLEGHRLVLQSHFVENSGYIGELEKAFKKTALFVISTPNGTYPIYEERNGMQIEIYNTTIHVLTSTVWCISLSGSNFQFMSEAGIGYNTIGFDKHLIGGFGSTCFRVTAPEPEIGLFKCER